MFVMISNHRLIQPFETGNLRLQRLDVQEHGRDCCDQLSMRLSIMLGSVNLTDHVLVVIPILIQTNGPEWTVEFVTKFLADRPGSFGHSLDQFV